MARIAKVKRKTKETDISVSLDIDGSGKSKISTGIKFLDHMLELFAKHGLFDLDVKARGDIKVDIHHTNEDVGIALGEAFKKALGDKKGIRRFGASSVPMDEALAEVSLDISGRPSLYLQANLKQAVMYPKVKGGYYLENAKHLIQSFTGACGVNMHIKAEGEDLHHMLEAIFKALARAMYDAAQLDERVRGIPSTKGKL